MDLAGLVYVSIHSKGVKDSSLVSSDSKELSVGSKPSNALSRALTSFQGQRAAQGFTKTIISCASIATVVPRKISRWGNCEENCDCRSGVSGGTDFWSAGAEAAVIDREGRGGARE